MTTFATCGHEIADGAEQITAVKAIANDYDLDRLAHAVSYQVLCPDCLRLAEAGGEVLHGEDEEQKWLTCDCADWIDAVVGLALAEARGDSPY